MIFFFVAAPSEHLQWGFPTPAWRCSAQNLEGGAGAGTHVVEGAGDGTAGDGGTWEGQRSLDLGSWGILWGRGALLEVFSWGRGSQSTETKF